MSCNCNRSCNSNRGVVDALAKAICLLNEGIDDISKGLDAIRCGDTCCGEKLIRKGLCALEDALKILCNIANHLSPFCNRQVLNLICEAICDIKEAIKGIECALQNLGNACRCQCDAIGDIEAALCKLEKAENKLQKALCELRF